MSGVAKIVRALAAADEAGIDRTGVVDRGYAERMSTLVVNMHRTETVPLHVHREHDELMVVLRGAAKFKLDGQTEPALAGDLLFAPAGVPHAVEPDDACVLLAVFGPGLHPDRPDRDLV